MSLSHSCTETKLGAAHLLEDGSELVLGSHKRGLVIIARPLASPLACNGVEGHVGRDVGLYIIIS